MYAMYSLLHIYKCYIYFIFASAFPAPPPLFHFFMLIVVFYWLWCKIRKISEVQSSTAGRSKGKIMLYWVVY